MGSPTSNISVILADLTTAIERLQEALTQGHDICRISDTELQEIATQLDYHQGDLDNLATEVYWELNEMRDYGPTLWETYTPEEKRARRSAMENALHDAYLPAMKEELNRRAFFLDYLSPDTSEPQNDPWAPGRHLGD